MSKKIFFNLLLIIFFFFFFYPIIWNIHLIILSKYIRLYIRLYVYIIFLLYNKVKINYYTYTLYILII